METRRTFLHNTAAVGAGVLLATARTAHAAEESGYVDRLTDADGKYAAGPLPFAYDALEPVIDARTVELHYNFHHKPAVAAANKAEDALAKARDVDRIKSVTVASLIVSPLHRIGGLGPDGDEVCLTPNFVHFKHLQTSGVRIRTKIL